MASIIASLQGWVARVDGRKALRVALPAVLTAGLMCLATAAGKIAIPGTPVPITLQTFVLMMMALLFDWRQVGAGGVMYLTLGACGFPVFAGGGSTLAPVGPSAGFLFGFLPSAVVCALVSKIPSSSMAIRALRNAGACVLGFLVVGYACGVAVQAMLTGMPLATVALASAAFIPGDLIKVAVSSVAVLLLTRR